MKKIGNFSYPLVFDARIRGFPSEYRHPLWYGKTIMVSLPYGEKISKISLFVLAQLTNVADRQTNRHTDGQTPHAGNSRAMHSIARQLRNVLNTNFFLLHTKFQLPVRPHISTILYLSSPLAAPVRHLSPHCPDQNHEIWSVDSQENY